MSQNYSSYLKPIVYVYNTINGGYLPDKTDKLPNERIQDFLQRTDKCIKLNSYMDELEFSGGDVYTRHHELAFKHIVNEIKVHFKNKKENKEDDEITKKVLKSTIGNFISFIGIISFPFAIDGIKNYLFKNSKKIKQNIPKTINNNDKINLFITIPLFICAYSFLALTFMGGNLLNEARELQTKKLQEYSKKPSFDPEVFKYLKLKKTA